MKVNQKVNIEYAKTEDDVSKRTIIPVSVPASVALTIDVTDLSDEQADLVSSEYKRYLDYREHHMKMMFNFNDWLQHTGSEINPEDLKYRSFKPEKTTIVD